MLFQNQFYRYLLQNRENSLPNEPFYLVFLTFSQQRKKSWRSFDFRNSRQKALLKILLLLLNNLFEFILIVGPSCSFLSSSLLALFDTISCLFLDSSQLFDGFPMLKSKSSKPCCSFFCFNIPSPLPILMKSILSSLSLRIEGPFRTKSFDPQLACLLIHSELQIYGLAYYLENVPILLEFPRLLKRPWL